jgi:hypothetical protein
METIQKIALAITGVAMITTLMLPGRQTPQVFRAAGDVFSGGLRAAMGR